jgi:hypothetical protein
LTSIANPKLTQRPPGVNEAKFLHRKPSGAEMKGILSEIGAYRRPFDARFGPRTEGC